jgi:hypothetical protein
MLQAGTAGIEEEEKEEEEEEEEEEKCCDERCGCETMRKQIYLSFRTQAVTDTGVVTVPCTCKRPNILPRI